LRGLPQAYDRRMRSFIAVAAVVLAAGCGESQGSPISNGNVEVNGRHLSVQCSGAGSPTVVLDAGLGLSSTTWIDMRPRVARFSRVCAYDRLGEGESDAPPGIQTVADQARTLGSLIDAAGWSGPFVLVGHSWGGAAAQEFTVQRRDDVAGIVLVDSTASGTIKKALALLAGNPALNRIQAWLGPEDPLQTPELVDVNASNAELRQLTTLGRIPLVALTAGDNPLADKFPTVALKKRAYAIWLDGHARLARLSTNSVHAIALYSSHFIHESQPDVVVAAIRAVVDAVRNQKHLPPCSAVFRGVAGVQCL
jgi:pimeloyl-ACP methyl ester carboxylesterase